jgi:hypothetical protein
LFCFVFFCACMYLWWLLNFVLHAAFFFPLVPLVLFFDEFPSVIIFFFFRCKEFCVSG